MSSDIIKSSRPWIGGGGIAAINGIPNPGNRTPLTEYFRLRGEDPELDAQDEEFFEGRKSLEPYMAHKLRRKAQVEPTAFNIRYSDPEYDFLRAEIDAETEDENDEFKTSTEWLAKEFGEEGSDDFPMFMAAQIQWGLGIRPKPKGFLNVCLGFDRYKRFPVDPNPELFNIMRERALAFMFDNVLAGVPPEPMNIDDVKLLYPKSLDRTILAPPEMVEHLKAIGLLTGQIKLFKDKLESHYLEVVKMFGDADMALLDTGGPAATYRSPKDSIKTDMDKLLSVYEHEFTKMGPVWEDWVRLQREALTKSVPNARRLLNKLK